MRLDERDTDSGDDAGYATRRLRLRPMHAGDRTAMAILAAEPLLVDEVPGIAAPVIEEETAAYAIVANETGLVIGHAGHQRPLDDPTPIEICLWLDPSEWGRGYGTEAAHALVDLAFDDVRVGMLWCAIRVNNTRARRVIEKCGFQYRGSGMLRSAAHTGAYPVERYMLDRRNWTSLKAWGAAHADTAA